MLLNFAYISYFFFINLYILFYFSINLSLVWNFIEIILTFTENNYIQILKLKNAKNYWLLAIDI